MNRNAGSIGEDDLQAYVDNQLDPDRRREVDAYLDTNPETRKRILSLRADVMALREGADEQLALPTPMRLRMTEVRRVRNARRMSHLRQAAAGIILLIEDHVAFDLDDLLTTMQAQIVPEDIDRFLLSNHASPTPQHWQ